MLTHNLKKLATKLKQSPLMLAVPVVLLLSVVSPPANALNFDEQINELKQANTNVLEDKKQLSSEAVTLSETIASLQAEAATLDGQISDTTNKVAKLKQDIAQSEKGLAEQRTLLTLNVRKAYAEQDMTMLEMLASSKNLSHFVDQQEYRSNLQTKVNDSADYIGKLKQQLSEEKKMAENLLADQKAMQQRLDDRRAESTRLLGLNQQQQVAFEESIKANADKIAELQREQAAENQKGFVSQPSPATVDFTPEPAPAPAAPQPDPILSSATYPWADAPFPNDIPDPWGMYQRQCVSYTAWKVAASGRHMPYWGGIGNANQWDDNAIAAGIPVDTTPRVGDIAVSNAGTYGHVMYVEAVYDDGTIYISQYNADLMGNYSEGVRSTAGLVFIHFP